MANVWKDPAILDTQATVTVYTEANDGHFGGTEFIARPSRVQAIKYTMTTNADVVELRECIPDKGNPELNISNGKIIARHTFTTGDPTVYSEEFNPPRHVQGIYPKTISAGCKVMIFFE